MPTVEPTEPPDVRSPIRPDQMGIRPSLIEDIILRRIQAEGRIVMTSLADKLHASVNVIDPLLLALRDRKLIEFDGMEGRAYVVSCTDAGRATVQQRSKDCRYSGPLPVSLDLYCRVVRAQRPHLHLDRARLVKAFSDLVIAPDLLDALGPAIHGNGAMFLYGPPGTGKSSIAERLVRAHEDVVLIPHCVEVDGQIISIYDPTLHDAIEHQPPGMDRRWVACSRPAVVAGGEMVAAMLDLQLDRDTGVYLAPLQCLANNGILVIDDFGRQAMSPTALLNRWIVPLDRGVDYLTLHGRKFQVPFELKVVLSTNLDPSKLGDEAFFRRIHNKIYIGAIDDEQFEWILARVTKAKGLQCDAAASGRLRAVAKRRGDGELRAYLPGVVCEIATAVIRYENLPPTLTPALVDRVLDLFFTRDLEGESNSFSSYRPAVGMSGEADLADELDGIVAAST